jgi:hypothetical protein
MAVQQLWPIDIRMYQGLSSDSKPIAPEGSKFYCLDTGTRWTYHQGDGWVPSVEDINMVWDTNLLAPVLEQQSVLQVDKLTLGGSFSVTNWPASYPISQATPGATNAVEQPYRALKVYISGTTLYICKAQIASLLSSAVWQIKKVDTASDIVLQWCDGDSLFNNTATDLATVQGKSYS